ncbi:MAG: transposase [Phycisphaerae bacterium]|nr:transposase [Phycisphaerae bacterium]
MRIHTTKPLFAWECLEDSPSLKTISDFLRTIPDGRLLEALSTARGRGRNDYPVHTLWGTLLLTILLRHISIVACLAELKRNPALRKLIGIDGEHDVPTKWSVCRFLVLLGRMPHLQLLHEIFDTLVERLAQVVGDRPRAVTRDAKVPLPGHALRAQVPKSCAMQCR